MIRENKFPRKNSDWVNRENKFPRKFLELLNRENKFPRKIYEPPNCEIREPITTVFSGEFPVFQFLRTPPPPPPWNVWNVFLSSAKNALSLRSAFWWFFFSMEVGICETCILTSRNIYYFPRKWTNSGNLRKNCWNLAEIAEILGEKIKKQVLFLSQMSTFMTNIKIN